MAAKIQRRPLFPGHRPEKGLLPQVTQHGRVVWYFRVGHGPRVRIGDDADFGSNAFVERYKAAKWGKPMASAAPVAQTGLKPNDPRSVAWLIRQFKASPKWPKNVNTARNYESHLREFERLNGGLRYRDITPKAAQDIYTRKCADGVPAAKKYLTTLSQMCVWATGAWADETTRLLDANPFAGVQKVEHEEEHHHGWTDAERAQFCAHYPQGSRERLAYVLLYGTGLRCSDAVRLGRQHLQAGAFVIRPEKTRKKKKDFQVAIPVEGGWMADLKAEIDAAAAAGVTGDLTYLTRPSGTAWNASDFSKWFSEKAKAALVGEGEKGCTAHGLRRAASAAAIHAGFDAGDLAAMFGYTLTVAEGYIADFDPQKRARAATEKAAERRAAAKARAA